MRRVVVSGRLFKGNAAGGRCCSALKPLLGREPMTLEEPPSTVEAGTNAALPGS